MRNRGQIRRIAAVLFLVCIANAGAQIRHRALVSGCGLGYVAIVNDTGFEWKHIDPAYAMSDIWLLPNGTIIYPYQTGVRIIRPDFSNPVNDKVIWDRPTPAGGETHSCQPLDGGSGRFLIGESYDTISYLLEVDTSNRVWKKIALPRFGSGSHNQFRQVRKTAQNTYLVTRQAAGGTALEYDSTGKLLRTFPDGRYGAERLSNGSTLIACGDNSRMIEVNSANQIVWNVGKDSITGITLGYVAGFVRLQSGNTVITNWGGHVSGTTLGASVVEITRDKKIVWSVNPLPEYRISAVQILDDLLPPYVPVLKAPGDSAGQQPSGLSLAWNSVPGSPVYRVQLSTSSSFTSTVVDDSTVGSTSRTAGPLAAGTTWYWRVRAKNGKGASAWSKVRSFTIAATAVVQSGTSGSFSGMIVNSKAVRYALHDAARVTIRIYTVQGRLLKTLRDSYQQTGNYRILIDQAAISNGVCLLYFKTAAFTSTVKLTTAGGTHGSF